MAEFPDDYHMFIIVIGRLSATTNFSNIVYESPWCVNYRYPDMGPKLKLIICKGNNL